VEVDRQKELEYTSFAGLARALGRVPPRAERPVVCVQGLGFVGMAVAAAAAAARESDGTPSYHVVGLDLPHPSGMAKVEAINDFRLPLITTDEGLRNALSDAQDHGNLLATVDERVLRLASVTVVCIPFDVVNGEDGPTFEFEEFRAAIRTLGELMAPGSLLVVETTVPPGTCEKVVVPELGEALARRGLPEDAIMLAHSPERVTPGEAYLDSVVNASRCYAGHTEPAADACEAFLSKIVNVEAHPLVRLPSTVASETTKVLENSYRAMTIAFVEEWARFAESVGIDLFEVVDAIRMRSTHSNMREPGFGVGGYCLTKDPLLAAIAARELFNLEGIEFPFSTQAVAVNEAMPSVSFARLKDAFDGDLQGKTVLLMGVTYRAGIGDTRRSPSESFVRSLESAGALVSCHDPLLSYWPELDRPVSSAIPSTEGVDAIVFAVRHPSYREVDLHAWLDGGRPVVLDACNLLSGDQRALLEGLGSRVVSIGRGSPSEAWTRS
jgi:nucleotide sugar dehydrogenase